MNNSRLIWIFLSFFVAIIFVYTFFVYFSIAKPRYYKKPITQKEEIAVRGSIFTDEYTIAKSKKLYGVYIYPEFIDPQKKELFFNLFSIYSGVPVSEIKKKNRPLYKKRYKKSTYRNS